MEASTERPQLSGWCDARANPGGETRVTPRKTRSDGQMLPPLISEIKDYMIKRNISDGKVITDDGTVF